MKNQHYQIRTMTRNEIDLAIDWAAIEGWNPGLYDQDSFFAADPSGFLIGVLDGNPIACISGVKYGDNFGFIGFYIVKPEFRGRGYGIKIWQAAISYLAGRTIGLDGVVSQQDNYKKFGFRLAYQNIRYRGLSVGLQPKTPSIVDLSEFDWEQIKQFDREVFSEDRSAFLDRWLRQPGCNALACSEEGQLVGYGMVRVCRMGFKFGPLFAKTPFQAEQLFLALEASLPPGSPFFLDIPAINPHAVSLANRYAMQPVFETARMYLGQPPDVPIEQVYGVTSFELG